MWLFDDQQPERQQSEHERPHDAGEEPARLRWLPMWPPVECVERAVDEEEEELPSLAGLSP